MSDRFDPITGDVGTVFFHYAIPSVVGMLAATTAGVIDGIFVGNYVGSTALAATNICMPVFALFSAVVFMLAVGGSVMCGKFIGEGRSDAASSIFSKTMYASLGVAVLISTVCLVFINEVVGLLGANEELAPLVKQYMVIIVVAAPLLILGLTLDYFVRIDGRPILAAFGLVAFAAINIAMDWLLIAQWGWGIEGAAWATAIAEGSVFFILVGHLFSSRCTLRLISFRSKLGGGWRSILDAAYNGFSEFANEMSVGLVTLLFNWVMITRQGVEGVAAEDAVSKFREALRSVAPGGTTEVPPDQVENLLPGFREAMADGLSFSLWLVTLVTIGATIAAALLFRWARGKDERPEDAIQHDPAAPSIKKTSPGTTIVHNIAILNC